MPTLKKHLISIIYFLLFLLTLVPFVIKTGETEFKFKNNELFDEQLAHINSLDKSLHYVDSIYSFNKSSSLDTLRYIQVANKFVRERFYYGISHYNISDNWLLYLSGKYLWSHLSAIVSPEDILKHPYGLCSQQTIVFLELMRAKKIDVRTVELGFKEGPGHFLCEVHYHGKWHLYDVSKEPAWERLKNQHESMSYYLENKDSLLIIYKNKILNKDLEKVISNVKYGKVNEFPAKRMLLLHKLSNVTMLGLPIAFVCLFYFRRKKENKLQD